MAWKRCFYQDVFPLMAMVSVELTNVGVNTLFKAASLKGMSYYVYILYSYAISTVILLPVPFIFRRTILPPSFKLPLFFKICLLALTGFLAQIAGTKGLAYTSPTLASAMGTLIPAFTFIFAVIFRLEQLILSSSSTQAKIIGTATSIAGALVAVLYKGPTILSAASPSPTMSLHSPLLHSANSNWLTGGVLLATEYILFSFWNILQSQILIICPIELLVTFYYLFCVTIIAAPVCFMAEQNLDAWQLRPDATLVAIISSVIFERCYTTIIGSWAMRLKGPIYVAAFKPLSIAIAAISGVILLGDALHLGIIIGALVISMGFYAVIWGNANEERSCQDHGISNSGHMSTEKVPFLQTSIENM